MIYMAILSSLKRFDTYPNQRILKRFLPFTVLLFIGMMFFVNYMFDISNYPVSFFQSQLCFSGPIIKSHFAQMTSSELQMYTYAQYVDYGYMIAYGLLIFCVGIFLGRLFPVTSFFHYASYIIGLAGILAACCDAIEDVFILLMVSNPIGFPDIYAVIHSCFASVKFAILGIFLIWVLLTVFVLIWFKVKKK